MKRAPFSKEQIIETLNDEGASAKHSRELQGAHSITEDLEHPMVVSAKACVEAIGNSTEVRAIRTLADIRLGRGIE
jgi:hypothetical protein